LTEIGPRLGGTELHGAAQHADGFVVVGRRPRYARAGQSMAPKPRRWTGRSPPRANAPEAAAGRWIEWVVMVLLRVPSVGKSPAERRATIDADGVVGDPAGVIRGQEGDDAAAVLDLRSAAINEQFDSGDEAGVI
jgi:hypothetical protein